MDFKFSDFSVFLHYSDDSESESILSPDFLGTGWGSGSVAAWVGLLADGVWAWVVNWTGIGCSLSNSSLLSPREAWPSLLIYRLGYGTFTLVWEKSLENLRHFRRAVCLAAASTNSFEGWSTTDFLRGFGVFIGVAPVTLSSSFLRIMLNCLFVWAASTRPSGVPFGVLSALYSSATTSTLPFVGFCEIGLSRTSMFGICSRTSFEAVDLPLPSTGHLVASLCVSAWLVEADGKCLEN